MHTDALSCRAVQPRDEGPAHYSGATPDVSMSAGNPGLEAVREVIRREMRLARRSKSMSQEALGKLVSTSRFTINRLENGQAELHPELADRIDEQLGTTLVALVAKRDQVPDANRDAIAYRLLHTPNLQRVRIVLADDLDVSDLLEGNEAISDARVEIIVPSARREKDLFGSHPVYGHLEGQLRRLGFIEPTSAPTLGDLELFESEDVLFSAIVVRSPAGMECAYWPPLMSHDADAPPLPVVSSSDMRVAMRIDLHIDSVKAAGSSIQRIGALGILTGGSDSDSKAAPIMFTRFVQQTSEGVEDLGTGEGVIAALVLVHAVCPRRGLEVGRRVVVHRRPGRSRWSLISHSVDELDVRRAKVAGEAAGAEERRLDLTRSSVDPLEAVYEHHDYLVSGAGGSVPVRVFEEAASRELFASFGLAFDVRRLIPRPLPAALLTVDKHGADDEPIQIARVIPQLFDLELVAEKGSSRPELSVLKDHAEVEEWGVKDFEEHDDLNDFLLRARGSGDLSAWLKDLGIVAR